MDEVGQRHRDWYEQRLTPEMLSYIRTGNCPRCGVTILSSEYVQQYAELMPRYAYEYPTTWHRKKMRSLLVPPGANVKLEDYTFQCMMCHRLWSMRADIERADIAKADIRRSSRTLPRSAISPTGLPSPVQPPARPLRAERPSPPAAIDVRNYGLIGVKDERQVEKFLSRTKKQYTNNSHVATITQEISITNTVTSSVTVETERIRVSNAQAGITILGFAAIEGQIQQQLSHRYATTTERELSISERTAIEIPPLSTVEYVITWKVACLKGGAILGRYSATSVEVPYWIPLRLTYDAEINDVPRGQM
jgi:hypothetical protein